MNTIQIETRDLPGGALAVLRLDKGRGNAVDEPLVDDLIEACGRLDADPSVRGVLLASAHPRLFCPGLDLVGLWDYDRPSMERFMLKFARAVWALYGLRKPLVAALGGHAVAGGCVLALTADWRILRRGGVNIGLNEIRVGVPLPWSVAVLLRASLRPERVCEAALLGRNYADEAALAVGFVHELAPGERFEEACLARLRELADKDPAAFATTKGYLRAEALASMKAHEEGLIGDFVTEWFSDATRARVRATIDALGKPKP
jgi:enoyl-CoA hydratase